MHSQAFFSAAFFFDWNIHFVVFSGGVERGLGGLTARSSWKIRQNKGWEARRLDLAGMINPCCLGNYQISLTHINFILKENIPRKARKKLLSYHSLCHAGINNVFAGTLGNKFQSRCYTVIKLNKNYLPGSMLLL